MNIIFFGTPDFVQPILEKLKQHFDVTVGNSLSIKELEKIKPDLFVVAAYGKILPKEMLSIPKYGSLNVHPSLLPKYRGPSPLQTAILNGDTETGVSIIKMDEKMDHGPILYQEKVALLGSETFESLAIDLFQKAADALPDVMKSLTAPASNVASANSNLASQTESDATFTKLIKKEDGYFDIENPPSNLDRMIRAYYPWPGVFTKSRIKNQELRIKFLPEKKLQVEGGKPMSYKDFINGYPELKEIIGSLFDARN